MFHHQFQSQEASSARNHQQCEIKHVRKQVLNYYTHTHATDFTMEIKKIEIKIKLKKKTHRADETENININKNTNKQNIHQECRE